MTSRAAVIGMLLVAGIAVTAMPAAADERFALIISGVSGGDKYAESYKKWVAQLDTTLRGKLGFPGDHIVILTENGTGSTAATREGVAGALAALQKRVTAGDTLLIVLIGHGTADSAAAKFNLVGPDWDTKEWKQALAPIDAAGNGGERLLPVRSGFVGEEPHRDCGDRLARPEVRHDLPAILHRGAR